MTRHELIACARQFLDVRFAHQGRSGEGVDCLGLLLLVAARMGLEFDAQPVMMLDVPSYGMRPDTTLLKQKLDGFLVPIAASAVQPADVVLLKVNGAPQHLAILCDYPMAGELGMIHAYMPARKVIEHRYDAAWRHETYAAYRLPQIMH